MAAAVKACGSHDARANANCGQVGHAQTPSKRGKDAARQERGRYTCYRSTVMPPRSREGIDTALVRWAPNIASLIDCHSTGTPAAVMYRQEGRDLDTLPAFRFVTGSLHVNDLKATPINGPIEIRGQVKEIKGRKVIVETFLLAGGVSTARGEVVAVQMPESFGPEPTA